MGSVHTDNMNTLSRCFRRCSVRAEQAVAHQDMTKAVKLLDERIKECCEREQECERVLMAALHALRCMEAILAIDPYPEVLMHRLMAQVIEKNAAQRDLDRTSAVVQQLKAQRRVLEESDLSSEVVFTLQRVMRRMQPHVRHASQLTDKVVDMVLEQREETKDVTSSLTQDLDNAFDHDTDMDDLQMIKLVDTSELSVLPNAPNQPDGVNSDLEAQTETELLMQAIRAGQREQLLALNE